MTFRPLTSENLSTRAVKYALDSSHYKKRRPRVEQPEESETEGVHPALRGLGGYLGHGLGVSALGHGAMGLGKLMPQVEVDQTLPEIARNMEIPTPHLYLSEGPILNAIRQRGEGPEYQHIDIEGLPGDRLDVRPAVHMPSNQSSEAILAHEMGHAKNWQGRGAKTFLGASIPRHLGKMAPFASAYAMGAEKPSYVPAAINAALQSGVLLDEGVASARALQHMVGKHGLGKGLLHSSHLLPAFGSYAANALAPLAITKIRRWNDGNEGNEEPKVAGALGAVKHAAVFGAGPPEGLELAAVPYDVRQQMYDAHMAQKALEPPTGYPRAGWTGAGIGGGLGALLGGIAGRGLGSAGLGALAGGALGGLTGLGMAAGDYGDIEEAQSHTKAPKSQKARNLAGHVASAVEAQRAAEEMAAERRHQQMLAALGAAGSDDYDDDDVFPRYRGSSSSRSSGPMASPGYSGYSGSSSTY